MLENNKILLEKIAKYYIAQLKADLKSEGHFATGKLSNSINYNVADNEITFWSTYTNEFGLLGLSEGRKPTTKNPPKIMVDHISEWINKKGLSHLNVSRVRKGSMGAGRFKKGKASSTKRSIAYGMAKGMLRKGYEGSNTIENSYRKLESRIDNDILEAYKKHLEEEVNKITLK